MRIKVYEPRLFIPGLVPDIRDYLDVPGVPDMNPNCGENMPYHGRGSSFARFLVGEIVEVFFRRRTND